MKNPHEGLNRVLDSITEHIAVIDDSGEIRYVNKSWLNFANDNACAIGDDWRGVNCIEACDKASAIGDNFGTNAAAGIRSVITQEEEKFYLEYPCHSPDEERWFMMRATPLQASEQDGFVISHQCITDRKLAEDEAGNLTRIDGLTDIPNRRAFDPFLHDEWRRSSRLRKPICLAIVGLDHFKTLNDTHGHQCGDECLVRIGALLKKFDNRASDICARHAGEEFALIWGDTTLEQARWLATSLLKEIPALGIANANYPTLNLVTASIGLAEVFPTRGSEESELIGRADNRLYRSKHGGRNRVAR